MISKLKGIVLAVIVFLASIMMPFNVYADTITSSNINGISVSLDEVTNLGEKAFTVDGNLINVDQNYFLYTAEIQFDKSYIGNININMQYTYQARNDTGIVTYNGTKVQKVFVNGDKAYMSFGFIAYSNLDPLWYNSITYSLTNSDVLEYGLISDIQQIIDILQENQDIIDDIYTELQNVVANTELANDYLEDISILRQYHFPFESYPIVSNQLSINSNIVDYYYDGLYYDFPVFQISKNSSLFHRLYLYQGESYVFRFIISSPNAQFTFDYPYGSDAVTLIKSERIVQADNKYIYFVTCDYRWVCTRTTYVSFRMTSDYTGIFIPIYFGNVNNKNISTDFALRWGLSNQLLDDLHIIANGTTASENAAGQLESANTDFNTSSQQLITFEDSMNDDMNDKLDVIDTTTGLNIFGQNFLTSAEWVRIQFNHLTTNTPYGSMVVYGLTLGLALLLLGKVFL